MIRVIPDFSKDKAMNSLSIFAEVVFRRLWNKADDFGRYYADSMILRAELFPRRDVRTPDISRAIADCENAALLVSYTIEGEEYLQIHNFNQRVRVAKSKFPPPPNDYLTNDGQMSDNCPQEREDENEEEKRNIKENLFLESAERIWQAYPKKDDKKNGVKAILKRLNEGLSEEYLISRVQAYCITVQGKEKTYIKNAQGWFNGERYKDASLDNPVPPKDTAEIDLDTFRTAWYYIYKDALYYDGETHEKRVYRADFDTLKSKYPDDYNNIKQRLQDVKFRQTIKRIMKN